MKMDRPPLAEHVSRVRQKHHWLAISDDDHASGTRRASRNEPLAQFLGWFSIGLGLAEVVAPRALAGLIGAGTSWRLLPLFGAREIASGMGIVSNRRPAGWLWSRVIGDTMDLGFLAAARRTSGADANRLTMAALAVLGVTALDILESARQSSPGSRSR